ncbi:MAG: FtsX-like permease family protein [Bacteroidota bacterium]
MSTLAFYLRYASRSLQRSGQRGLLAVACVAFGVFSLVSLQLLAASIHEAVLVPPRHNVGGDLSLSRESSLLTPEDLASLAADPDVDAVDAIGTVNARFIQTLESSRVFLFNTILAVDPEVFPLVGSVDLRGGQDLASALAAPNSIVITSDLASTLDMEVGDQFRLAGLAGSSPIPLTLSGIAEAMPNAKGSTLIVGRATARTLNGDVDIVTRARVLTAAPDDVTNRFEAAGWTVVAPQVVEDDIDKLFGFALPAAGLLGLLVGGIGVANTLQVLLSRRRKEVATLKTLGYRQRDLLALFGIETAMLGAVGGIVGIVTGILGSLGLQSLMAGTMPFLLQFKASPSVLVGGMMAGVVTAVLFGMIAIVRTSSVRPSTLLRETPIQTTGRTRLATIGLSVALFGLFGVLGSALVGSFLKGFGVIAGGIAGLVLFGAVMVVLLMALVRVPIPGLPLLRMAMSNLRRQPIRAAASLVALFVGTYAIGVSSMGIKNASEQVQIRTVETTAANLVAFGLQPDAPDVLRIADGAPVWTDRSADAQVFWPDGTPVAYVSSVSGRGAEAQADVEVAATPDGERTALWLTEPGQALVPWRIEQMTDREVALGDTFVVQIGEAQAALTVAGFYDLPNGVPLVRTNGLVVLPETFDALAPEGSAGVTQTVAFEVPPARLEAVTTELGEAFPDAVLVSGTDVADMMNLLINSLFTLVIALTSLALVAGTVLVANGVGLALVERRRELSVLKSIGYSARQVLQTVVLENALLGLIAGALGVGATVLSMVLLSNGADVEVTIYPSIVVILVLVSIGLAAGSALLVAWHPVRSRPLDVLRAA